MPNLKNIFHRLTASRVAYQPVIEIRISKAALLHNLGAFRARHPGVQFAPVIKSNAYGHGMVLVAKILDREPKPFFAVDSFYEALVLRRAGIRSKILMLGYNRIEQLVEPKLKDVASAIIDFSTLRTVVARLRAPAVFHLKIDTGMHRQGLCGDEIAEAIAIIKSNPNFILEGLCSHLADADSVDDARGMAGAPRPGSAMTERQIALWNETAALYKEHFPGIKYFHLGATAGAAYSETITANSARLGIGLYGFNASPLETLDLRPVLEMVSVVSSLRVIPAGETVGYNATWTAARRTIAATVPAGYTEGVDRRLSNKGWYKIGDAGARGAAFCPIIGRVSMNISSVDVTDVPAPVKVGDEVVIISRTPDDKNSVAAIAQVCGTIPYEILVHLPGYLKRTVA